MKGFPFGIEKCSRSNLNTFVEVDKHPEWQTIGKGEFEENMNDGGEFDALEV